MPAALASMPTASLPIEPASSDRDLFSDHQDGGESASSPAQGSSGSASMTQTARAGRSYAATDFGTQLRMKMSKDGFGAQLKGIQYTSSWLGVTESLRYFSNEGDAHLFKKRYGFLLGMEAQVWRGRFLSPFVTVQGGWERFTRDEALEPLDSYMGEASAGLEMSLGRYASLAAQWTEAYYMDLKEPVFAEQKDAKSKSDLRRHATAEVFFNLRWAY